MATVTLGNNDQTPVTGNVTIYADGALNMNGNYANNTTADLLNVSGTLTLSAGMTANSRFTIALITLDANNNPAALSNFIRASRARFCGDGGGRDRGVRCVGDERG